MSIAVMLTAWMLSTPARPSFDCAKAATPDEVRICADAELAQLDRRLATLFSWSVGRVNGYEPQDGPLREAQRGWLERRGACGAKPEDELGRCVRAAYLERIAELERSSKAVPDGILVTHRFAPPRRPGCSRLLLSWPEIVQSSLLGVKAFNASFEVPRSAPACDEGAPQEGGEEEGGREETASWFQIVWTTERYVTVVLGTYQYTGGVHGSSSREARTFDLVEGHPVHVDDVFIRASSARKRLAKEIRERIAVDLFPEGVRRIPALAFHEGFWTFDGEGAAVTFPQYAIGPYSSGMPEARFTWRELRPFLRPASPLPPR